MKNKTILACIFLGLLTFGLVSFSNKENRKTTLKPTQIANDSSFAQVFPTTFTNEVFIKGISDSEKEVRVEVFAAGSGILVRTFVLENALNEDQISLDMTGLKSELFVIRVYEDEKLLIKQRVVKSS